MARDVLYGRKEITEVCGEPQARMTDLVRQGLKAWKTSEKGTWKCFYSDAMEFLDCQKNECLKRCQWNNNAQ
jgi:hypothetical protein